MAEIFVSLGSNLDRDRQFRRAARALREAYTDVVLSPVYESAAVGFDGPPFYNAVARATTEETLDAVLGTLRAIEDAQGRVRRADSFHSRTLDLDLLLYDDLVLETPTVALPRDEILRYAFVLGPLADLAGTRRHPVSGLPYAELWAGFDRPGQALTRIDFEWEARA
ncbi:MAG: 2-amino-4-hydroxy-6-hydroxymethyldihydropteridine diphosphokinase [Gammaproteobacteria bacterium]|nr:2-amino-4-hydroxy-6-hydroxymethyldihydropteridine diphosphokinase [Gammaproteobacteria bacterium]